MQMWQVVFQYKRTVVEWTSANINSNTVKTAF